MSLTLTPGYSFSNGEKVTPTKSNLAITGAGYTGSLEVAKGGTGATTAAAARTSLGLGAMATNTLSVLEDTATNVNQTGEGTGTALVFNTDGAPTVTLTAGKWLVIGTVAARMSDTGGAASIRFSNSAGSTIFGGGAAPELATVRSPVSVFGYKDVPSGTFDVYFYGLPETGSTINLGETTGAAYAGTLTAVRLEGA